MHEYAITDAFVSKSTRILKLQNPWNDSDKDVYKRFTLNTLHYLRNLNELLKKLYKIKHHRQSNHISLVRLHNLPAISNGEL